MDRARTRCLDPIDSIGQLLSITVGRNTLAEGILYQITEQAWREDRRRALWGRIYRARSPQQISTKWPVHWPISCCRALETSFFLPSTNTFNNVNTMALHNEFFMLSKAFIFHEISLKLSSLCIALWTLEEKIAPLSCPKRPVHPSKLRHSDFYL